MTTHSLGDMATATRIESIENARLTSSTRTTVAQNGVSPSLPVYPAPEVRIGQVEEVEAPQHLYPPDANQVDRQDRGGRSKREPSEESVAKGLVVVAPG